MPDAPGLELIAQEVNDAHEGAILGTYHERGQACLIADPDQILEVLRWLKETPGQEYAFLASVHGVDYLPAEPRFGVHYELLNMPRVERVRVRAALADAEACRLRPQRRLLGADTDQHEPRHGIRQRDLGRRLQKYVLTLLAAQATDVGDQHVLRPEPELAPKAVVAPVRSIVIDGQGVRHDLDAIGGHAPTA